ncbi:MAG: 6-phosphofructokinase, partial [Candidatus Dormibacteria bacterium]
GEFEELTRTRIRGIIQRGGTILGTARFHPHEHEGGVEAVIATLNAQHIDAVVVLGGDGTLNASFELTKQGVHVIGLPKTIDNDASGTEQCIGHDTAVAIATEAIDRLHTTAESHDRLMVVEVMGRMTGWIAVESGLAAGADAILIPENPVTIDTVVEALQKRHQSGANSSIVVVAEGAHVSNTNIEGVPTVWPQLAGSPVGAEVSRTLAKRTGFETRLTVLGHVQRGGEPTARDRIFAARIGAAAVGYLHEGLTNILIAGMGDGIRPVPLTEVTHGIRTVPEELRELALLLTVV